MQFYSFFIEFIGKEISFDLDLVGKRIGYSCRQLHEVTDRAGKTAFVLLLEIYIFCSEFPRRAMLQRTGADLQRQRECCFTQFYIAGLIGDRAGGELYIAGDVAAVKSCKAAFQKCRLLS